MLNFTKYVRNAFIPATIYSLLSGVVVAEDTEIFFNTAYNSDTRPNVLFIMDTSGSMGSRPAGQTSGPSKMQIVKDSLNEILTVSNKLNVGLARYTVPGGPILYPVKNIDAPADPMVTAAVRSFTDDAEESTSGAINHDSIDLDLMEESGHAKFAAIRFSQVNIPQGALINSARASFTARGDSSGSVTLRIFGELVPNSSTFTTTAFDISSRAKTVAYVDWTPSSFTGGKKYSTVDLSPILKEIVAQAGWCGGNALSLIFERVGTGSNSRIVESYDGAVNQIGTEGDAATALAAQLRVKFDGVLPSGANGCYTKVVTSQIGLRASDKTKDDIEQVSSGAYSGTGRSMDLQNNNYVGLRFSDINVPQGATVYNAELEVQARGNITGTTNVTIRAAKVDDFTDFATGSNVITSLLSTGATSNSSVISFSNWLSGKRYVQSGSFDNVLNEVFAQSGWASGNALALLLKYEPTSTVTRGFASYDDGSSKVAKLKIGYKATYESSLFTVRDELKNQVNGLNATGWTPISDTLLEGGLYYRGENVRFGKTRKNNSNNLVSHPETYSGGTHNIPTDCDPELDPFNSACASETISGDAKYISPITDSCQGNHIVFLTDGQPTWHDPGTSVQYNAWSGQSCTAGTGQSSSSGRNGDDCTIKIAGFLNTVDQSNLPATQSIKTHFIGFDISLPFLRNAAQAGGGGYYEASNTTGLIDAFQQIINSILQTNATFVSAGISVNQANRLKHLDRLYFSLFGPTLSPRWPGNVKRYQIRGDGIYDANGVLATNPVNDQFLDDSKSWWSSVVDGNNPSEGGAASLLTNNRPIYSNIGGDSNINLVTASNRVTDSNSSITEANLGAANAAERLALLKWIRGVDVDDGDGDGDSTEAHNYFGDPLHSQPALVTYRSGATSSLRLFVGTNSGTLTSLVADTGVEAWSFMPKEYLSNIKVLRDNISGTAKPYGLDSSPVIYVEDANKNGAVDVGSEKAYLFIGMRRGGDRYYAVDISNPDSPTLMYVIKNDANFDKLGQTHASPLVTTMNVNGSKTLVLVFGGGYDTTQDIIGGPLTDGVGNALYIANAKTGAKIWSSDTLPTVAALMTNSIPSAPTAIDLDGNGRLDHIYVVDTKAQIFRFDFSESFNPSNSATFKGGRIASLQPASATVEDNRRFFAEVDAALDRDSEDNQFVALAVGSGYREHPLDAQTKDSFYVVRDYGVFDNTFPTDIDLNDLVDITNLVGDVDSDGVSDAFAEIENNDKLGWYLRLTSAGEKVISRAFILDNVVYFSTYLPPDNAGNDCTGATGRSRFYAISLSDGNAVFDSNITDPESPWYGQSCSGAGCRSIDQDSPLGAFTSTSLVFDPASNVDSAGMSFCPVGSMVNGTNIMGKLTLGNCVGRPKWRHQ